MSIHDEQEIERLRAVNEKLRDEIAVLCALNTCAKGAYERVVVQREESMSLCRDLLTNTFEVNNTGWKDRCWEKFTKLQKHISYDV